MEGQAVTTRAPASAPPGSWPAFFRRQVSANVHFWLAHMPKADAVGQAAYPEHDNVLKALQRAIESETAGNEVIALVAAYHPLVERRGDWATWRSVLERGLQACRRRGNRFHEAVLLDRLGEVHRYRGEWQAAEECHQQAVEVYRACDTAPGEAQMSEMLQGLQMVTGKARALANLGEVYQLQHRYDEAERVLGQALEEYRAKGNAAGQAFAHNNLGITCQEQGRYDEAFGHFSVAHDLWREAGNRAGMARAVHNQGTVYSAKSEWVKAEECLLAAAALYEETGSVLYSIAVKMNVGNTYLKRGQPAQAEAFYRQTWVGLSGAEYPLWRAQAANNLGMACARQDRWTEARGWYEEAIALHCRVGNPLGQANSEDNLAEVYIAQAQWAEARAAVNRARALLADLAHVLRARSLLSEIEAHEQEIEAGSGGRF